MYKRLIRYFFNGLIFLLPVGLTIYIFYISFTAIDNFIQGFVTEYLPKRIPGIGIFAVIILVTLLGFMAQSFIFKPIHRLVDKLFQKTPIVKVLYSSIKDLLSAFVGQDKKFDKPVLVLMNKSESIYKIGFLTSSDLSKLGVINMVAVYLPHAYNFSGELFIVPADNIKPLNIQASDAMKYIISGAVTKI
jgi:uncharacterized membrane protein